MGLPLRAWDKKIAHSVETHWLCGKEKIPDTVLSIEDNADSDLGYERTYHYWFP